MKKEGLKEVDERSMSLSKNLKRRSNTLLCRSQVNYKASWSLREGLSAQPELTEDEIADAEEDKESSELI